MQLKQVLKYIHSIKTTSTNIIIIKQYINECKYRENEKYYIMKIVKIIILACAFIEFQ